MDKTLKEIFTYNVKNASDQLLTFIELTKEENWNIEDLISNVEWVALEMQKQHEENIHKFITAEKTVKDLVCLI